MRELLAVLLLAAAGDSAFAQLHHIIGVSIPVGSSDPDSAPTLPSVEQVWSVHVPPYPLNTKAGIGYLLSPQPLGVHVLNDHKFVAPHTPDPARAQVTYHFDRPVIVDQVEMVNASIIRVEALVGDSLETLRSIGTVLGNLGDFTDPNDVHRGGANVFDFNNTRPGSFLRLIVRQVGAPRGYASLQIYPRDRLGRRFLAAVDDRFDADGDGIPDLDDNCPESVNPKQEDQDQDGFGDACDPDRDGDGWADRDDNCPGSDNPLQEDADGDHLGDPCDGDRDGDGVEDLRDNAPGHFNAHQTDLDGDGRGDVATGASLVQNGGFENQSEGMLLSHGVRQSSSGAWLPVGPVGAGIAVAATPAARFTAVEGQRWILFNVGESSPGGSMEQQVPTTPGSRYALSFSPGRFGEAPGGIGLRVEVLTDHGSLLADQTVMVPEPGWKAPHALSFRAASPRTLIRFSDVSTETSGVDAALDAASLELIPESSTAAAEMPPDRDGDGILDSADNCPDTPNSDQADMDLDGIGDGCDEDIDDDGVPNRSDLCPMKPGVAQVDSDGDGLGDECDSVHLNCIIRLAIPTGSCGADCACVSDGIWSVTVPPFPFATAAGVGRLVNPAAGSGLILHDHHYQAPHTPDPARAVITYTFDRAVPVDAVEVIQHADGITQIAGFLGDDPGALAPLGVSFGNRGDVAGRNVFTAGEATLFAFSNRVAGSILRLVITRTSLDDGFGAYQIFPRSHGQRLLAAALDTDLDEDGFAASTDPNPGKFNSRDPDADGDGLPDLMDPDRDGDGIPNERDNCPDRGNPDQADKDGDRRGDPCDHDLDGDGFENPIDIDPLRENWNHVDWDGDGNPDSTDPATRDHIVLMEVPAESRGRFTLSTQKQIWSVAAPPFPFNRNAGIGQLTGSGPLISGVLQCHGFSIPHSPGAARAMIDFRFDQPITVESLEVRQGVDGITRVEGFAGDSPDKLESLGEVFGPRGDVTGNAVFAVGETSVFRFPKTRPGVWFRVVITKTSHPDSAAIYRMFPVDGRVERLVGARVPR